MTCDNCDGQWVLSDEEYRRLTAAEDALARMDNEATDHISALVDTQIRLTAAGAQLATAVEFLRAYRDQGAPGRAGRALLDEFLDAYQEAKESTLPVEASDE